MTFKPCHRAAIAAAVAIAFGGASADAAPCGRPDVNDTIPQDGATDVPTNATLSAHYAPSAEHLGETVRFEHVGVAEMTVEPTFNENEGILSFTPEEPLVPGDDYIVEWPELRGRGSATLGLGATVEFVAGRGADETPPEFGGLTGIEWDIERDRDECTDSLKERFRFDLDMDRAEDDGGRESLTLVVFQTAGRSIDRPEPVLARRMPERDRVAVELTIEETVGHVCFAAIARDLVGRVSTGGEREVCVDTVEPPFLYGCRIAAFRKGSPLPLLAIVLALGLVVRRGGRRTSVRSA